MSGPTGGWAGRILRLDLSKKRVESEATARYVPDYIGGKGIATRIAWDEIEPGTGPYSPDNLLMFMTGPFSGTLAPTSGKGTVCSVSPRTLPDPWFTYSGMGGNWTPELKYAGFDGIVVKGIAPEPLYLLVCDGEAELRPAADLWGKDVFAVQELLKERHGTAAQVICIGAAGEHWVVSATIHHRQKNCSGMAGFGAVMGAKNLKAIVIRGTGSVPIADPRRFVEACKRVHRLVHAGPTETPVRMTMGPTNVPCAHACPFGCATRSHDVALKVRGGKERRKNISVMCNGEAYEGGWNWYQYPTPAIEEKYAGELRTRAVEGLGKQGGDELQLLIETLGLSGWSYLTLRCWFLACLDHGVHEIEGLELRPTELDFWLELFRMIAYREGLGDLLADGLLPACERLELPDVVKRTAKWLEPMWGFPSHRDGRACEPQPSPLWIFDMLHWAIDSRDPLASHHQTGYIHCWFPPHYEGGSALVDRDKLEATFTRVFGDPGILEPGFDHLDAKTRVTKWFDDRAQVKDSLLLCDWVFPRVLNGFDSAEELAAADDYYGDVDAEASMLAPLTGLELSTADLDRAGERIRNLDRALQIRNSGRSRAVDATAEWVFEYPEKSDGTRLDQVLFDRILDHYYDHRGWDRDTGWPTRAKLEELGLPDAAEALDRLAEERSAEAGDAPTDPKERE
jgi:aldehyde:ferredoxin oxidoreductase